ncbi:GNAT family N-acetyltransferase [Vitiosangium sp. GDMCC 1.1324]|uniref:GNAT family N-acetyltransferase n=1 Tax=Vitiosangium sp. (strain GDMCC 1.1324) TaxID=2138576 RepID=UPI000D3CD07F|nr:GNAT family N-acetyltransferase [Vitiosangium sp. GDMCC 1.1324]PTL81257.1 GNAT family N-acetyltransferase [Vitiosangium sp. GDMCC 1.1324]
MLIGSTTLPTLETSRLRLRWLTEADIPALYELFSHPEVTRYWSWAAYTERAQAEKLLRNIHRLFAERSLFNWGIARREDDRVVGTCTLSDLNAQNQRASLGYAVNRAHWGQGYGREAVSRVVEFGFTSLELHRLEADVDPRNTSSIQVLARLGFKREGYQRERYLLNGERQDAVLYGLLRPEWQPAPAR